MVSIIISKAEKLVQEGKVKKEVESDKRTHFTVQGTTEKHSVIFDKEKGNWSCDCKYSSLYQKSCSHIVACQKIMTKD